METEDARIKGLEKQVAEQSARIEQLEKQVDDYVASASKSRGVAPSEKELKWLRVVLAKYYATDEPANASE